MNLRILSAGPLTTLQDTGRPGWLAQGISASGPMDRRGFARAGEWLGNAGSTGLEFTSGLRFQVEGGPIALATDGGDYRLRINGNGFPWPARAVVQPGDVVEVTPGAWGNWGYLRFDRDIEAPLQLGSRSTNSIAGLGRILVAGDHIRLCAAMPRGPSMHPRPRSPEGGPIRVIWGLHADIFDPVVRHRFVESHFAVSTRMDRMGMRLEDRDGVFTGPETLSLISDAIVPGDIQILGDGVPIVLMRDHQPTGGYPRIATIVSADLDRFSQLRPGSEVRFVPVSLAHALEQKP